MKKVFLKIVFITFILFQIFSFNNVSAKQVEGAGGTVTKSEKEIEKIVEEGAKKNGVLNCPDQGCLTSKEFTIDVSGFTPGGKFKSTGEAKGDNPTQKRLNYFFDKTIKFLMIPFGVLAILVMTIGAGFMVVANGQDELLSKGKRIFKMGIISLVIALSSYLIIELLKTILYY